MLGKQVVTTSVLVVLVVALLVGCESGESDPPDAGSSPSAPTSEPTAGPSPSETGEPGVCSVLLPQEVGELTGEGVLNVREAEIGGLLPACIWGSLEDVGVQAGVVDAALWARSLPEVVASLKETGTVDVANLRKLDEAADLIESGREIPAAEACDLFSELVELNGLPAGSDTTVNVVPNADDPQAIGAQTCRDGTYATVLLVRPDLTGSPAEARSVRRTAEALLSRRSR